MATATLPEVMTTEALLELPVNGTDRWLIKGELREKPLTVHNRFHSSSMAATATFVGIWRDKQPEPRGQVLCGEAGVRLARNPDTTVGIDVVYVSAEVIAHQTDETTLIDGIPLLAVEILSPSDTIDEINEMIDTYLAAGVLLVWVIDPHRNTVMIHQPNAKPRLVTVDQVLTGDPVLPGLEIPTARLFD